MAAVEGVLNGGPFLPDSGNVQGEDDGTEAVLCAAKCRVAGAEREH
eukprot:SAG11_NODE_56_length_19295_cov_20.219675_18_plen_46_part_00